MARTPAELKAAAKAARDAARAAEQEAGVANSDFALARADARTEMSNMLHSVFAAALADSEELVDLIQAISPPEGAVNAKRVLKDAAFHGANAASAFINQSYD